MNLLHDIHGKWDVTGEGAARPIDLLGDVKIIDAMQEEGRNILYGEEWGYFSMEVHKDYVDSSDYFIVLNYDDERNSIILRQVRDKLYKDGEGWRGILYLCGKKQFSFRLKRKSNG